MRRLVCGVIVLAWAHAALAQVPPAPADLTEPPADATKSATGLISRVLQPGTSTEKPGPTDIVTVHYTGWASDGRMFDSSVARGNPSMFPVNRVMAGLARVRAADGAGRAAPVLGAAGAGLQGPGGPPHRNGGVRHRAAGHAAVADDSRRPTWPSRRRTSAAAAAAWPTRCCARAPGVRNPDGLRTRDGALHGLDHRRQDVRQLGGARHAGDAQPRRRDSRVEGRRGADGRGRAHALLDSRRTWPTRAKPDLRRGCWCSTSTLYGSNRLRAPGSGLRALPKTLPILRSYTDTCSRLAGRRFPSLSAR